VLASVERLVSHQLKHHTKLVIDVPSDLPPVRVASRRLEQVFVNLLINAAEALEANTGSITVRARPRGIDRVVIEVIDNGPGIAPAVLARMFEPFFTTKGASTGTGLGLASCQTIVTDVSSVE
jgi:signal transduction histidine kinase